MAKDFFGSLGETLTKTARELSDRAEEVYETQLPQKQDLRRRETDNQSDGRYRKNNL